MSTRLANTNNGVMEVYWFRFILWSICACAVGVHALKDPEVFKMSGDYHQNTPCFRPEYNNVVKEGMCQWCAGNVWYDEWFEQCSRRNAVICNVHKLKRLVHEVTCTSKSSKEYRNGLLLSHLRQLLGGYVPECPLVCYGEDKILTMCICSTIGRDAITELEKYLQINMNSSKQENQNVEEFVSLMVNFREEFCSRNVRYSGLVAPQTSMMPEVTSQSDTKIAVTKKEKTKPALSEVVMWYSICVVGLIIVGVIIILLKICRQRLCPQRPETHRYGLSPDRNPNTDDAEVDYGSGSLIDGSAVSSLDVDSLYQDDALESVSMVRPTGPDAASIESGSTNDDYMGPYRVIEDSYSAQRPKRKHKTSDDESPHVIL